MSKMTMGTKATRSERLLHQLPGNLLPVANPKLQNPKKYRDAASVCNVFEALDSLG
jgi:hypothetical protein